MTEIWLRQTWHHMHSHWHRCPKTCRKACTSVTSLVTLKSIARLFYYLVADDKAGKTESLTGHLSTFDTNRRSRIFLYGNFRSSFYSVRKSILFSSNSVLIHKIILILVLVLVLVLVHEKAIVLVHENNTASDHPPNSQYVQCIRCWVSLHSFWVNLYFHFLCMQTHTCIVFFWYFAVVAGQWLPSLRHITSVFSSFLCCFVSLTYVAHQL